MAEDFGDADDGDFGVVGDDVHAGGAHLRAAHAEDFYVGALLGGRWRGAAAYMSPESLPVESRREMGGIGSSAVRNHHKACRTGTCSFVGGVSWIRSLPATFFHDAEQVFFGVFNPHQPQVMIGHARDDLRLPVDGDVFGFGVGEQCVGCREF